MKDNYLQNKCSKIYKQYNKNKTFSILNLHKKKLRQKYN